MSTNKSESGRSWRTRIGLSAQLLFSHAIAAAVGVALAGSGQGILPIVVGAVTGMALTLLLQRTLWLLDRALAALAAGHSAAEVPPRWHGPLGRMVADVNVLAAREREVRDLRQHLLHQAGESAAQQERNRLARELHDSIKQQLFSIGMSAAAVQARWESDPPGARKALGDVQHSTQEAMVEMNALLQQLSPTPLEKVGLAQALRDQCEAFGYRSGAQAEVEFGPLPDDSALPPGAQDSLFRIAQEALSNVARHARAGHMRLYLGQRASGGPLVLEVWDDGQGFESGAEQDGMGLNNICQRAAALGGEMAMDSAPGRGTTLCVQIPLVEPAVAPEDAALYRPDHTLNRTVLVGLGGGLALIVALAYPLYLLLPGRIVAGWPAGSRAIGFALQIAAALLAVAAGFLAARWTRTGTRQAGTLLGALGGGVAGLFLYFGLGAPAAGVVGNSTILAQGLVPTNDEAQIVWLLAEAVIGTVWASHGAFWAALLTGLGLGAIGGLLAPPAPEAAERQALRPMILSILSASTLASALACGVALLVFSLAEVRIGEVLARYGTSPETTLPLAGVSLWPIGTTTIFYVASLTGVCLLLRVEAQTEDEIRRRAVPAKALFFGLLSLGVPAFVWLASLELPGATPVLRGVAVAAGLTSLVLGAILLVTFVEAQRQSPGPGRAQIVRTAALAAALASLVAISWTATLPSLASVLVAVAIIAANLVLIAILRRQPGPTAPDTTAMVRLQLSMTQSIGAALGMVVALLVPWMPLVGVSLSVATITTWFPSASLPPYTLIDVVRDAYATQSWAVLVALVGAGALVGLLMLYISGRMILSRRLQ